MRGLRPLALSVMLSMVWLPSMLYAAWRVGPLPPKDDAPMAAAHFAPWVLVAVFTGLLFGVGLVRLAAAREVTGVAYQLINAALWSFVVGALGFVAVTISPLAGAIALLLTVPLPEALLAHGLARVASARRPDRQLAWLLTALLASLTVLGPMLEWLDAGLAAGSAFVALRVAALAVLLALLWRAWRPHHAAAS